MELHLTELIFWHWADGEPRINNMHHCPSRVASRYQAAWIGLARRAKLWRGPMLSKAAVHLLSSHEAGIIRQKQRYPFELYMEWRSYQCVDFDHNIYQCSSPMSTVFTSTPCLNHLPSSPISTSFPLICLFRIRPSSAKVQSSSP